MGIWAGIQHALNSTLGTKDFKSLDQMILGMRSLQASDNVYMTLSGFPSASPDGGQTVIVSHPQSITPYTSGSLKFKVYYVTSHSGYYSPVVKFSVYINGSLADISVLNSSSSSDTKEHTLQISYQAGDVITLEVSVKSGGDLVQFSSSKVEILGTLTEYNALNIKNL